MQGYDYDLEERLNKTESSFTGTRNFCEEQVSDIIWTSKKGTQVFVKIEKDDLCVVRVYK